MRPITWWLLFVHLMLGGLGAVIDGAPARPAPCWRAPRRIAEPTTQRFVGETARPQWQVPPWTGLGMPPSVHASRSPGRGAALPPFAARGGGGLVVAQWQAGSEARNPCVPPKPPPVSASKRSDQSSLGLAPIKLARLDRWTAPGSVDG